MFANNVPKDDQPILNPTNISVVAAFASYLDDVDLSAAITGSDQQKQAIADAQADVKEKQEARNRMQKEVLALYNQECPNGYDAMTDSTVKLPAWWPDNYPEWGTCLRALKEANDKLDELTEEYENNDTVQLIRKYRENLKKGQDPEKYHPGFNLPANMSNPAPIIANPSTATDADLFYVPAFNIGGDFNGIVKNWVDSFPTDYPANREAYEARAQKVELNFSTSSSWKDFGFDSSASASSSNSGWFIWGQSESSSSSKTVNTINISTSDFTENVVVRLWDIATFPIQYGLWYTGNPINAFPTLNPAGQSNPSIKSNLLQQYTSVTMAYGVEITLKLSAKAYQKVSEAVSSAQSSENGYVNIFGWSCGGDSSSSSRSSSWSNITMNDKEQTLTAHTDINGVPVVVSAVSARLTGV
ncbi:hypothetical protein K440DRAFT_612824 [Wilcoxina mikolae CBS 423.85]|nr:hypothetical protein K440DRAFT_612824 [Wilcoxina mikolae CBS 423.85]